ncbi:MAG: hypothetical protein Fur0010_19740 [Bdellovibrio sp.]
MFLNGAPTFAGGFAIFGSNDSGDRFSYTVIDDSIIPSMELPNGNWNFWAIGWDNANKLEGTTKCGQSAAALEGGDIAVGMTLSIANCGTSNFAPPPFINTNQFHPVVVTSCYNATVTDATSTCDGSFKGEHRSFRFVLDTISNFGPLPNPQHEQVPNSASISPILQSAVMSDDGLQIWMSGQALGDVYNTFGGGTSDSYLFMMTAP